MGAMDRKADEDNNELNEKLPKLEDYMTSHLVRDIFNLGNALAHLNDIVEDCNGDNHGDKTNDMLSVTGSMPATCAG